MKAQKDASSATKFWLLTWKNFLIQWRHPKQTLSELLVPVLAMSLILLLRSQIEPTTEEQINYPPIPASSLNFSTLVLAEMLRTNFSEISIAYSPTSPVLDDVMRSAMVAMLLGNVVNVLPIIEENFPGLLDAIPPPLINSTDLTQIENVLKTIMRVDAYNSSVDLNRIYTTEEVTRQVIAAVEFPDSWTGATSLSASLSFALRFPEKPRMNSFFAQGGRSWRTTNVFPALPSPGPRAPFSWQGGIDPGYVDEMFIALQHSISMELISRVSGEDLRHTNINIQRYPHPAYVSDPAIVALQLLFPMFIILSFSYTAINITRDVTLEKELQLKESMKIMGLPTWLHWTAWFCKQFLFLIIVAVFIVLLLKISWFTTDEGFSDYAIFTNTPWTVLMFFLVLYLISVIILCFMVSSFFDKASTAALFMGVIWFITYLPAVLLSMDENISLALQVLACFNVNTAMSYGFSLMITEESTGGLHWYEFFYSPSQDGSRLLFGHVVLILLADCVLYLLVTLYVEQVFPGPFGSPQPWYFPIQRDFWCGNSKVLPAIDDDTEEDVTVKEPDPRNLLPGVKIKNLRKVYGKNTAVNNLNLNIFNDQITVLLGHNGAGKSTTISMLTGNVPPSGGTIWLAGYDVSKNLREARAQIGLCPQHNVLFSELTVREHLQFFTRLKGLKGSQVTEEADNLIEKLELQEKANYQSGGLSGGQKRRLSVAIALCGGAKVVLLDEPTSGMDPASRRALWDLLQKEKKDRCMILTTHFMDEADYLGDRIAIMSSGRLQCVGSAFFLKRHYGVGYTLVIVKGPDFDQDACTQLISKYLPDAQITEDRGSEVTYPLPNEHSSIFEEMLSDLEKNSSEIGYKSYGLTATTIEDVFMKAGSDVAPNESDATESDAGTVSRGSTEEPEKYDDQSNVDFLDHNENNRVTGWKLWWQHTYAMWFKLWLVWSRSWGLLALQIIVPFATIILSLSIVEYMVSLTDNIQARPLTLSEGFSLTQTYLNYDSGSAFAQGAAEAYSSMFDNSTMILRIVDQPLEDYYLQQGSDIVVMNSMRTQVLIGATLTDVNSTAWFSNFGYHDVAISLATLHSALLKSYVPEGELRVENHPLEAYYENSDDMRLTVMMLSTQFANGLASSISIVSAVFVMFYIKERATRAKLLQKASGVEPVVMWGSAAVFDWLWFMIICLTFVIACLGFQVIGYSSVDDLGRLFLCLMVYGLAMAPLNYLVSYLFSGAAFGFVVLVFINFLLGMMGPQIVEALESMDVEDVPEIMDAILKFFPLYSLISGVKKIHETRLTEWSCLELCKFINTGGQCSMELMCELSGESQNCCIPENSYLKWEEPGVLSYLIHIVITCVICWLLLMFFEYRLHRKIFKRNQMPPPLDMSSMDDDVKGEMEHVQHIGESGLKQHNLVARNLTKYYKNNLAVNQVSFSVGDSEIFGLLGVNGAGKTTTFKMLMGDETVSSGDAYVMGYSVNKSIKKVHENIGYCPQFDAVFAEMTGRETIRFFALLRGLQPNTINGLTEFLANELGFTKHLDKKTSEYSGGNRRKLSTAVSLTGSSRLVFLDEPTTGVDPSARRRVWTALRRAARRRALLLTSHSMDECEALCSRLTIMTNGQFHCLGTPQHLKEKFSQGFTLTIKMSKTDDSHAMDNLKQYVNENFDKPKLMEQYEGLLTYYLSERTMPWSRIFGIMERTRRELHVENYNISQTTLEQIFLQFTKYQR